MAKKLLGLCIWFVAVISGFFVSQAVANFVMLPLAVAFAPPDAGESYRVTVSLLIGFFRFAFWLGFIWLVAKFARKWLYGR